MSFETSTPVFNANYEDFIVLISDNQISPLELYMYVQVLIVSPTIIIIVICGSLPFYKQRSILIHSK